MTTELVFNELSHQPAAESVVAARNIIAGLVQVLRRARTLGGSQGLRVRHDFSVLPIARDYSFVQWRNDSAVDEVERRFFLSFVTKCPVLDTEAEAGLVEELLSREFRHGGALAEGLGVAFCLDGLGISFATSGDWGASVVALEETRMNGVGDLAAIAVEVRHASSVAHVDAHTVWLESKSKPCAFTVEQLRAAIEGQVARYVADGACVAGDKVGYSFGADFIPTAKAYGLLDEGGPGNLLRESCARVVMGLAEGDVKPYRTGVIGDGWRSFRMHLTESGAALRLMMWIKPDESVVFANIGPKWELDISKRCDGA
jgi:hypothetical protein